MEVLVNVKKQTTEALKQFIYVDCWDTLEAIKKQSGQPLSTISKSTFDDNQKHAMFVLRVIFKSCCYEWLNRIKEDEKKEFRKYFERGVKELSGK